jgi:hypothetical protein
MTMRISRLAAAVISVAALGLGAQTLYPPTYPPPKRAPITPKTTVTAAQAQKAHGQTDAVIEAAIRAKFAKSKINADKFQVHVQGGVATIEGKTDVIQHKGVATRMAKGAGAVAVNNHVQSSEAAKEKAAANLAKGRRRAQIKRGDARSETGGSGKPAQLLGTGKSVSGRSAGEGRK